MKFYKFILNIWFADIHGLIANALMWIMVSLSQPPNWIINISMIDMGLFFSHMACCITFNTLEWWDKLHREKHMSTNDDNPYKSPNH